MRVWISIIAALFVAQAARADEVGGEPVRLALLIGASGYDESRIGEGVALEGPKNDVALMIRALRANGVSDSGLIVLADRLDETGIDRAADGLPELARIREAFAELSERARPGDEVLIYMSGHGSRQPQIGVAPDRVEADGFDEIFLPLDIGSWEGAQGDRQAGVENALVDDELGELIETLRARQVFVWLVVDTCHSGTADRSAGARAPDAFRTRQVEMDMLGIPADAILDAEASVSRTRGAPRAASPAVELGDGGFVAFFAAHSGQLALEGLLPRGPGNERRNYGVMTYQIATSLMGGGVASYRDLAYRVLNGYDDWGARAPSPLFAGELDRPIFGASGDLSDIAWPVSRETRDRMEIAAGALNGVGEGAAFELTVLDPDTQEAHPDFTGPYFAEAVEVGETRTLAVLSGYGEHEAATRLPAYGFLTARLVDPGVRFTLMVAAGPPSRDPGDGERRAAAAIEQLRTTDPAELTAPIRFGSDGASADVFMTVADGAVWFLRPGENVTRDPRTAPAHLELDAFETPSELATAIERELTKIARVRNLLRAAQALANGPGVQNLQVRGNVWRPGAPAPDDTRDAPDDWVCSLPDASRVPANATSLQQMGADALSVLELSHCDIVYLEIFNAGDNPVDVTPLYLDSLAGVYRMPFLGPDTSTRIEPGAPPRVVWAGLRTWDWDADTPSSTGLERMILLAIERDEDAALPWDFAFLAQESLVRDAGSPAQASALGALMSGAGFGQTRSARTGPALDDSAGALIYQWRLMPPAEPAR